MSAIRLIDRLASYRRRRRAMLELSALSDHQLRDIGLTRHDLPAPRLFR